MGFISEIIGKVLSTLGSTFASAGSQACSWLWADEPEMPKSMIESDNE